MDIEKIVTIAVSIGGALWGIYKGIIALQNRRKKQLINARNQGKAEAEEEIIDEQRYKELLDKIANLQIEIERVSNDYQIEFKSFEEKLMNVASRIIDAKLIQEFIERNTKYYAEIEVLKSEIRNLKDYVYKSNRINYD